MRLVVAINDRCTISYYARRPIVRSIVATDHTIYRDGRRPMVGSIVASCDRSCEHSWRPVAECTISCGTRRSIVDQSLGATINRTINRSIVRPIVLTYGRSYDQSWHQTTDRTINRSIVRPTVATYDQSYDQSWHQTTDRTINCATSNPRPSTTGGVTMHDWWYDHVRSICDRLRFGIAGYVNNISFEHDHRPCYNSFCPDGHPRPLRPVVRSFYDLPTILTFYGSR